MAKVYEEITLRWNAKLDKYDILSEISYEYDGPVDRLCGASSEQKQTFKTQSAITDQMINQSQQIFGTSSAIAGAMQSAFAPIVAAGPNQEGYGLKETAALNSQAVTQGGVAASNAAAAVRSANAAAGGGNMALPSGASVGANIAIANAGAQNTANQLLKIKEDSLAQGRQNFFAAANELAGVPSLYNPATGAAEGASGAAANQAKTADSIAQANNSWVGAVTGALGGIAGAAVGGWAGK